MKRLISLLGCGALPAVTGDAESSTPAAPAAPTLTPAAPRAAAGNAAAMAAQLPRPSGSGAMRAAAFATPAVAPNPGIVTQQTITESLQRWVENAPVNERRQRSMLSHYIGDTYRLHTLDLELGRQGLTALPNCLQHFRHVKTLDIAFNALTTLPLLPPYLDRLLASQNRLSTLPPLPETLRVLDAALNTLSVLSTLPASLRELCVVKNSLQRLPELPETLEVLDANFNQLRGLPPLPKTLHTLCVNNNNLAQLPDLSEGLQYVYVTNTGLQTLPRLPASTLELLADPELVLSEIDRCEKRVESVTHAIENLQLKPVKSDSESAFEKMPAELISKIVREFPPATTDAASLSVTSQFFKEVVAQRNDLENDLRDAKNELALLKRVSAH